MLKHFFLIISFQLLCYISYSQVGIGTTDPTADLDINGNLRIRNIPESDVNNTFLTTDNEGNITKSSNYVLFEANAVNALSPINYNSIGITKVDNIDLGLSFNIIIPKNKEALVIINYSVPVGISSYSSPANTYYGVRFLVDGAEDQSGSRKVSVVLNAAANMNTINCVYYKYYSAQTIERSINITLNGYVEQYDFGNHQYRFNMWSNSGNNNNWGKATMIKQVFVK